METVLQLVVSGIALGCVYCLVAIEFSLIFSASGLINFGHDKFIPLVTFFMDPKTNEKVHWLEMLKYAASVQGVQAGIPRRPLKELADDMKQAMKKPLDILLS